jgi:pimeloyl-ACP methyl ester carboxylesterase
VYSSPAQAKPYTAELYTRVLTEFLRDLRQTSPDGVTVVASSLPAAYVVNIAAQEPNLVDRLLLVSPTGLDRLADPPNENFYNTLTRTPLGGLVAGVLRGRTAIDFFLTRQVYLDPSLVTPEVTEPYIQNLRGPDKEHPVFSFISGKLNASVRDSWPRVRQPTRIVWGSDDVNTPVEGAAAFRALRPEVRVDVLRGRAIPNDEDAQNFNRILLDFLQTSSTTTSAP